MNHDLQSQISNLKSAAAPTPGALRKIGVISDTHNFFDPKIPQLFDGVDHILHGGDVGTSSIIIQLEQIAPVTAVIGNTDSMLTLNETEVISLSGQKFLLHHIVEPFHPSDGLRTRIMRERPRVVVFGHTHKPFCETINGILFFNPGYAGKQRFSLPRSLAILHCNGDEFRPEFLALTS